jgi:hypothetical protein
MAKRKYSVKRRKIEPSVQTITLGLANTDAYFPPGEPGLATYFVDLSQIASVVNRRFYRQGINWAVAGFKVTAASATSGDVRVKKLPNTWVLSNAWEKSMRTWTRMVNDSLKETESVRPRFLDFKIFANKDHHAHGYVNNVPPIDADGRSYQFGEWASSKIVIPETSTTSGAVTEYELVAVGPNNPGVGASGLNAKSLIEGYASSRGLPNILDPNTPDDAVSYVENWMMAINNDGNLQDNVIIGEMIDENNLAPYPFENDGVNLDTQYPGGGNQAPTLELHDLSTISATTVGATTRLKGGNFPCGLIVIQTSGLESTPLIQIDLVPGTHRGYMCEPMTEM